MRHTPRSSLGCDTRRSQGTTVAGGVASSTCAHAAEPRRRRAPMHRYPANPRRAAVPLPAAMPCWQGAGEPSAGAARTRHSGRWKLGRRTRARKRGSLKRKRWWRRERVGRRCPPRGARTCCALPWTLGAAAPRTALPATPQRQRQRLLQPPWTSRVEPWPVAGSGRTAEVLLAATWAGAAARAACGRRSPPVATPTAAGPSRTARAPRPRGHAAAGAWARHSRQTRTGVRIAAAGGRARGWLCATLLQQSGGRSSRPAYSPVQGVRVNARAGIPTPPCLPHLLRNPPRHCSRIFQQRVVNQWEEGGRVSGRPAVRRV